jgi:hypothetical protein
MANIVPLLLVPEICSSSLCCDVPGFLSLLLLAGIHGLVTAINYPMALSVANNLSCSFWLKSAAHALGAIDHLLHICVMTNIVSLQLLAEICSSSLCCAFFLLFG